MSAPLITVVGSVNLDFVASGARLPRPGETVTGASLARHPGGKGANQALAARRLGAEVRLIARVGADGLGGEALALLRAEGVDLSAVEADASQPTGVALIAVGPGGENQIVVAPGANAVFAPEHLTAPVLGGLIVQLELPTDTVAAAVAAAPAFVCANLAPALDVPDAVLERADLIVVNETEAMHYGGRLNAARGLVAMTWGARGAGLFKGPDLIARARPPEVEVVDSTGAGDCFVAALTVALMEGREPGQALQFACAAGALATTLAGAQPAMPTRAAVEARMTS